MKKTIAFLVALASLTAFGAPNSPTAEDPMISITPITRSMEQTGGSAAINTAGNGTWMASTSANWILLTSSSGTAGYPVGYTVGANNGVEARVGYVYVSGYVHTITQAGLGATLGSYSAAFESEGGSGSVRVNAPSGKAWHAQSNADWIAVSTESGTGSSACAFTVAAYDEVSTRSGTLTIADNTFTVFQTGRRMRLGAAGATTDYFAGTVKIRVNALADTEWTVFVDADWLTVTDAGSGLGGDEVKVAVAENQSYNTRTGTVTIGTETFAVTQLGRTALVFQIAPTEVGTFGVDGAAGERLAVTATPDLGWTAAASADWIELYEGYGSGSGSGSVVYKVKPNPTLSPRSGSITVTAADGAVAAKRLDIMQEAAVASLTVEEYEFEAAGETLAVGVNTGSIVEWDVDGLPAWLSVSAASSTGPADITLTAAANTSVQPRSATIRIADHEFRVSQKGRGVTVAYEPHVFNADGKATGENADNPITVTADADVTWTAVASDDTWIIVYEGRTGQGNGTVRFIVAPYIGDGEVRTGLITIGSEIVYVTQRPYDLSIDPIGARVDGNAGAGEIQVALDIDGVWNAIATEPWIAIVSGYDAGTGNGKVLFSYTDNNTGRQRTGKIIIAGETYTLTQAARQLVAVSATVSGHGGTVAGGGTYNIGSKALLEAVPEGGYAFDHWVLPGGGTSTENPLSVTVTASGSYQAVFSHELQLAVTSASLKGVLLSWTALPWATEFRVFRGTSSSRAQATKIATVANDGSYQYLDATGTENQAYWYWIESVGAEDDVWSNGVQAKREKATFSIDYTNLRGTTHANPATYREGTSVTFTEPSARTGFTFLGWTPSGITADTSGDVTARANWAQNEYTVRFNLAGAAGSMADESFTYGLWKYLSPTNFSRPGYIFVGWAVKPGGASAVYDDSESVKSLTAEPDGLVTLYALWLRDGLDDPLPDLGASASAADIVAVLVGCVDAGNLGANITTAGDYADFRAWADVVKDCSGTQAGHVGVRDSPHSWLSYALGQETLLEAAPEPGDLVILDFAASESDPSRFDLLFGLDGIAVGSSAKPANLAKTFAIEGAESLEDGFSEEAVALLSIGPSEGDITSSVAPVSDAESFFFRVVERPLQAPSPCSTISFDSAGGSPVASILQVRGTSVIPPTTPTRTGYTFTGWSPAVPATMPATDMVCVAQWTPIDFTARFHANGGSGEMADFVYNYEMGASAPIPACAFENTVHSFAGWATEPNGEAVYANGETANRVFTDNNETAKDLYAVWAINQYTITFDSAGGSAVSPITQDYGTAMTTPADPTRTGYTFAGWSPTFPATMPAGDLICTAQWTPNRYTIHFDANGGTGEMQDLDCVYDDVSLGVNGLSLQYYDISSSGYSTWMQSEAAMTSYFANRMSTIATNTLDWGAGLDAGFSGSVGTAGDQWVAAGLTRPASSACRFHGKFASNGTSYFAIWMSGLLEIDDAGLYQFAAVADDSIVLYINGAKILGNDEGWVNVATGQIELPAGIYAISAGFYEKTGGQGLSIQWKKPGDTAYTPIPQSALGSGIPGAALPAVAFSGPDGAAFLGWSMTSDGLVEFADKDRVSNLSSVNGDEMTFYAKWNRGSFTVHFDPNGGTGEMPDQVFTLDVPHNLARNAFSKPNHYFVGWATNENGNVVYGNGAMTHNLAAVGERVTLWAVWEWLPPYMVVDLSSGSSATSYPVTYLAEPPAGGFNTDEYKTTKLVLRRLEPGQVPTRDATLTKPFFVGLFEVTQRQWELVMGTRPSYFSNNSYYATRPVEQVSYNMIRGSSLGSQWPASNAVDADSFLGRLRARVDLDFDLPTEAQWEYACRAGTATDYNSGENYSATVDQIGRFMDNGGTNYLQSCTTAGGTAAVGSYLPNAWGLYDMHGNVREWCLDWKGGSLSGNDPVGSPSGEDRVNRGGCWYNFAIGCTSSRRESGFPSDYDTGHGFRLVNTLSQE